MERLTLEKETSQMNMVELAHNSCYVKDSKARFRDYETDIDARELARKLLKDFAQDDDAFESDEDFDDYIADCLYYGFDNIAGLIAVFYRNLWAMADLREHLKYYEDLEEQGKFIKLPCKAGDTLYRFDISPLISERNIEPYVIDNIVLCDDGEVLFKYDSYDGVICGLKSLTEGEPYLGYYKVFLTRDQAEQALKELVKVYG